MAFVRCIGRWTMVALVINAIIGSGIFGLPGELTRLLGPASPLAMMFSAIVMAIFMVCAVEVASQFSESGGVYLYVRTALGRFIGVEIGWVHLLGAIGGLAVQGSLFTNYLASFVPGPHTRGREAVCWRF